MYFLWTSEQKKTPPPDVPFIFQIALLCPLLPTPSPSCPQWGVRWCFPAAGGPTRQRWAPRAATSSGCLRRPPSSSRTARTSGRRRGLTGGWRCLRRGSSPGTVLWSSRTLRSRTRGGTRASWWWAEPGPRRLGSSFRASSSPSPVRRFILKRSSFGFLLGYIRFADSLCCSFQTTSPGIHIIREKTLFWSSTRAALSRWSSRAGKLLILKASIEKKYQ